MDVKTKITTAFLVTLVTMGMVAAASTDITSTINDLLCKVIVLLYGIAAGIAIIVIVLAGIKWIASAEDAGARAQAKSTVIHAVIGLLIVLIAISLVTWVIGTSTGFVIVDCFA